MKNHIGIERIEMFHFFLILHAIRCTTFSNITIGPILIDFITPFNTLNNRTTESTTRYIMTTVFQQS